MRFRKIFLSPSLSLPLPPSLPPSLILLFEGPKWSDVHGSKIVCIPTNWVHFLLISIASLRDVNMQ